MADDLAPLGPLAVFTSPLRRCRETAAPLAERWSTTPVVNAAVAEIPSPPDVGMAERSAWLLSLAERRWTDADAATQGWRGDVVAAIRQLRDDAVIFSHFVAINVVLGAALGDDRVFVARFANCSRTVLDVVGDRLEVVEIGTEEDSHIG